MTGVEIEIEKFIDLMNNLRERLDDTDLDEIKDESLRGAYDKVIQTWVPRLDLAVKILEL